MRYFATFIAGTQDIIAARLQRFPNSELSVKELLDGVVVFESTLSEGQLSELRFFNNVYAHLKEGEVPALPRGATAVIRSRQGSQPDTVPETCLLYTSPSPRDGLLSRMPSSA